MPKRQKHSEDSFTEQSMVPDDVSTEDSLGRHWTVSIAVPSSIVDNAQSPELKSYLVGQIARALVVYRVDEIVVYDEHCIPGTPEEVLLDKRKQTMVQMIRILEYLECPQYLRRFLFPIQKYLQYAGLLNPLESHHHLKESDQSPYREGVVMNKPHKKGSFVNIGLRNDIQVDRNLQPNVRVTVKLENYLETNSKKLNGQIVSPSEPREKLGIYWGYSIRMANSLNEALSSCPFEGGYDLKIGTSDRGDNVDKVIKLIPRRYSHLLVVFGGLRGIEAAHENDESLGSVEQTKDLFDYYLNTCPEQGSDTIRTEEAILITLSALRKRLLSRTK